MMDVSDDSAQVASALRASLGVLVRRIRQAHVPGDLTLSQTSVLARLERDGPSTAGTLAGLEQISAQSMGVTISGLQVRGLVKREPDPLDGRRSLVSISQAGHAAMRGRAQNRTQSLAEALARDFTATERRRLMHAAELLERLARSI